MTLNNKDQIPSSVRVAVVQYLLKKINSFQEFADQCTYYINISANYKADFAVFPEIFTTQLLSFIEEEDPSKQVEELTNFTEDYVRLFSELALRNRINIVGGSHFIKENGAIYNVSFLFHRNGKIDKQYKIHITPNEKKWWGVNPGQEIKVFDTDRGKVAILICYDTEFPEAARIAVDQGADIIFSPFCTDDRPGYLRVRYCAQARAVENQVYIAIAGTVGNLSNVANMDLQYAQSAIFTPSDITFPRDAVLVECDTNMETVVVGDLDLGLLKRNREDGTVTQLKDRRRDLYRVDTSRVE